MYTQYIAGLVITLLATGGYVHAFRMAKAERLALALALLVLCGLALRMFLATDFFLHMWDERYHALVARNLLAHPLKPTLYDTPLLPYDFRDWPGNHIWLHKQPMALWSMALSLWVFGYSELAVRLPSVLLSAFSIVLVYRIAAHFFQRKVAFLAAFFFSINGFVIELASGRIASDHIDTHFLFFILLAVGFSVRFAQSGHHLHNVWAGVALGLAILTKWLPALIVLPVWMGLLLQKGHSLPRLLRHMPALCLPVLALVLPWKIYIHQAFPVEAAWESAYNLRHLTEALEGHDHGAGYYLKMMRIHYGEIIYLPVLWWMWKSLREGWNGHNMALLAWMLVPLVFFSSVGTKMPAYLVIAATALLMVTAAFFFYLRDEVRWARRDWLRGVLQVLLLLIPVRYATERIKPFRLWDRQPAWVEAVKQWQPEQEVPVVVLNHPRPIEVMFYKGVTAYSHIPEAAVLQEWVSAGLAVYICGPEDALPAVAGIRHLPLPMPED